MPDLINKQSTSITAFHCMLKCKKEILLLVGAKSAEIVPSSGLSFVIVITAEIKIRNGAICIAQAK